MDLKTEKLRNLNEIILSSIDEWVRVVDRDYNVVFTNRAMRETFGETAGKKCYEFWDGKSPCTTCVSRLARNKGEGSQREIELNGLHYRIQCYPLILPDGTCNETVEIITDFTDKKALAQTRESYTRSLKEDVKRKAGQILKNHEIILRERKSFEMILESMQDHVFVVNRDFTVQYMNQTMINRFGNRLGEPCHKIIHGKENLCEACRSGDVFDNKKIVRHEIHSSVTDAFFDVVKSPIVESDENVNMLVTMRDITEKKAMELDLRLNESRLDAILSLSRMTDSTDDEISSFALEEGVRLTGSSIGYMHFVNDDELNINLYSWSKNVLSDCDAEKTPHYPLKDAGVWADCLRLRKHVIHNDYPSLGNKKGLPEGHIRLRRHMSIPVFDDDKIVAVAGVGNKENPYDLSDVRQLSLLMNGMWEHLRNRRALEKIKEHSSTLEEQVQQLVERVRLNDRLALLGEISAGLAHELRNPLGSLMAGIKLLEREGKSREEKQTVFEILKKESERLNNALTDFLGYARPGRMQPVELDVSRMLTDIIRLIVQDDDLMGGSTIETDFDPDLQPLTADGDRVRQVIWNIMINGLKAMETPGVLHVRASSDDDWLRIDINDSGRGIAPENIEKIFNPFFSLSKGGTGLGLAIVRRIMQEHGGEIKVDSNAKSGTTFSVRFPLLRPEDNNF